MRVSFSSASANKSLPRAIAAAAVIAYLPIAFRLAWLTRFTLTPDGFGYVQAARHYAAGAFHLAVNGWWGPLLSWLVVPFIWFQVEPVFAIRILNVFFGIGFAAGVSRLVWTVTGGRGWLPAFLMSLLCALIMLPRFLTPDLLLACLVMWYLVVAVKMLRSDSLGLAFKIGLLGGVCYWTKAYALPFVATHLFATYAAKFFRVRSSSLSSCLRQYAAAMLGVLIAAAPWIGIISVHDGRLTISTAARYASLWTGTPEYDKMPFKHLNFPREGRIWCWENPPEAPGKYPTWSAFDGMGGMKKQLAAAIENIREIPGTLRRADRFGLMPFGLALAWLWLLPLKVFNACERRLERFWIAMSAVIYIAGYVPTFAYGRYLWGVWGMILALAIIGPAFARTWSNGAPDNPPPRQRDWTRWLLGNLHGVFVTLFFVSLAIEARHEWHVATREFKEYATLREIGQEMNSHPVFASNHWRSGLYCTYWADRRFLGEIKGKSPDEIVRELEPFGEVVLLVFGDPELASALSKNEQFVTLNDKRPNFAMFQKRAPREIN